MFSRSLLTFGGGPPLSETALRNFEECCQVSLPRSYRAFLADTNGGRPELDLLELASGGKRRTVRLRYFFGLEERVAACNLQWYRHVLASRLASDYLAVATTHGADKVCLSLSTGAVVHWDCGTGCIDSAAPSFDAMLAMLSRDSSSPTPTSSVWVIGTRR